jgi:hypothetical protein
MKVMMRTTVRIVPGKMAEYMQAEGKRKAFSHRLGMPAERVYMCLSGDSAHTLVYEMDWDSLAAMEAALEKMFADPERQKMMAEYDGTIMTHENELFTPIPS